MMEINMGIGVKKLAFFVACTALLVLILSLPQ